MIQMIENGQEMHCWQIVEKYPDHYILIKTVEMDYKTGKDTGIPLALSDDRKEFSGRYEGEKVVLTGDNLAIRIGGVL
ncbi:MAG: hypothetical protein FWG63_01990 [Defluviitaleaceae bacterium]|nr:hypothetical protein [Defluviitaleaceae bacterium]